MIYLLLGVLTAGGLAFLLRTNHPDDAPAYFMYAIVVALFIGTVVAWPVVLAAGLWWRCRG